MNSKFQTIRSFCIAHWLRHSIITAWGTARKAANMPFAPLRRVILRSIEVFSSCGIKPDQFVIVDQLECGHTHSDYQWTLLDLVNPYSENAKAKRHRCRECAAVISKKRPQSVTIFHRKKAMNEF